MSEIGQELEVMVLVLNKVKGCRIKYLSRSLHASLHTAVWHSHAVWVHLLVSKGSIRILHTSKELTDALSVAYWAVFVLYEEVSKVSDFIMESCDLRVKGIILCRVHLNFSLKVGQPLLLALSTFERSNSVKR